MRIPSDLAGVPDDAEVPRLVAALPGGDRAEAVWRNGEGGVTFRLPPAAGLPARHAKWQAALTPIDLADEARRLAWAARHAPVPRVVGHVRDDDGEALVTETLEGTSAVLPPWTADPARTARELGAALRRLHDALPVAECPWEWSTAARIARVADASERARLAAADPGPSRLVVCHGDACAPNTLLGEDGRATAHVDLGALGVGEPWADLAVLSMSTVWNYGEGVEDDVYAGYGVAPDRARIAFFRDLWNAG